MMKSTNYVILLGPIGLWSGVVLAGGRRRLSRRRSPCRTRWLAPGNTAGRFRARIWRCCRRGRTACRRGRDAAVGERVQPVHLHAGQRDAFAECSWPTTACTFTTNRRWSTRSYWRWCGTARCSRALAAEAIAKAKVEVARARAERDRDSELLRDCLAAQRKFGNSQTSLHEAERFLDITQKQEKGGEVAHADVIKAQIDLQQRQRDLQEAQLAIEKAKIALGVLMFPEFQFGVSRWWTISTQPAVLPHGGGGAGGRRRRRSPDIKVGAGGSAVRRRCDVQRGAVRIPAIAGAGSFLWDRCQSVRGRNSMPQAPGAARCRIIRCEPRRIWAIVAQVTLNIPVWNWGATRSKVKQAELKREQAQLDLTLAQRQLQSNLRGVRTRRRRRRRRSWIRCAVRSTLAAESLRLTLLRYQAGEATALEVVDAQNTATQARNAYDDGLARYRVALANLQTLTGTL